MNFNRHLQQEGRHALLGASTWHWLNDNQDSLLKRIRSQYATEIGTILHNVACKHITYRIKMTKSDKKNVMLELLTNGIPGYVIDVLDFDAMFENLMTYTNDGIGFKMKPEVVLYYSDNFFGTTDAIHYSEKDRFLRIHDYKSGTTPARMEQLMIYDALFCLEYRIKPTEFDAELRIYQNNEIIFHNPEPEEILDVMNKITSFDKFLTTIQEEV